MLIENEQQAEHHAVKYLEHLTLVVSEKGSISASCDIDETCKVHESKGEKFFIVRGTRIVKKAKEIKVIKKAKDTEENEPEIK